MLGGADEKPNAEAVVSETARIQPGGERELSSGRARHIARATALR